MNSSAAARVRSIIFGSSPYSSRISCMVMSAASRGLKPRVTRFRARFTKSSCCSVCFPCSAQLWDWNLAEASRSNAAFASGSLSRSGAEYVQPHCEHAHPWGVVSETHRNHLPMFFHRWRRKLPVLVGHTTRRSRCTGQLRRNDNCSRSPRPKNHHSVRNLEENHPYY